MSKLFLFCANNKESFFELPGAVVMSNKTILILYHDPMTCRHTPNIYTSRMHSVQVKENPVHMYKYSHRQCGGSQTIAKMAAYNSPVRVHHKNRQSVCCCHGSQKCNNYSADFNFKLQYFQQFLICLKTTQSALIFFTNLFYKLEIAE